MIIFHQPVNHLYHITEQIAIHRDKSRNKKFDKKKIEQRGNFNTEFINNHSRERTKGQRREKTSPFEERTK